MSKKRRVNRGSSEQEDGVAVCAIHRETWPLAQGQVPGVPGRSGQARMDEAWAHF